MEFSKYADVNPKCGKVPNSFYYIDLECVNAGEIKDLRIEMAETAPSRAQRLLTLYDILFQTVRPYQKNNYHFKVENDLPTVASTGYAVFRTEQSSEYLYELIHTERFLSDIMKRCTGTSFPAVSSSDIEDIAIWIPKFQEQKKIGDFLTLVDTKIAKQRLLIEHLKKYKRGVMNSYFNGKLVLKHSIGQHYSHWQEFTLSDVSDEFKSGKSITSNEINEVGEYAVYGGNGVRGYTDHYSHEGQYIVVGRQGALCGNVRIIDGKNYLSEHAIAVKANSNHYTPFLLYLLTDMRLGQYSDQGAQPGLAVNKLLKLKRRFPEYDEQVRFATFMQQIDHKLSSEENKLEYITTLKRGLLQQLFI